MAVVPVLAFPTEKVRLLVLIQQGSELFSVHAETLTLLVKFHCANPLGMHHLSPTKQV